MAYDKGRLTQISIEKHLAQILLFRPNFHTNLEIKTLKPLCQLACDKYPFLVQFLPIFFTYLRSNRIKTWKGIHDFRGYFFSFAGFSLTCPYLWMVRNIINFVMGKYHSSRKPYKWEQNVLVRAVWSGIFTLLYMYTYIVCTCLISRYLTDDLSQRTTCLESTWLTVDLSDLGRAQYADISVVVRTCESAVQNDPLFKHIALDL